MSRALLLLVTIALAACAQGTVVDPGPPSFGGQLSCIGVTTAECNAGAKAVLAVLSDKGPQWPATKSISIAPGAGCPPDVFDCSYGLLQDQRLLGHAVVEFADETRKGYANLRVEADGRVSADPITNLYPLPTGLAP